MSEPKILGLFCQWGGYAAAEMAAVGGKKLPPQLRIVRLACTGRVDPVHVIDALAKGYAGVAVVGCDRKVCRYETGNWFAQSRVEWLQIVLQQFGFSPERLLMGFADSESQDGLVKLLEPFTAKAVSLGKPGTAEGIAPEEAATRLTLIRRLFSSKELRWLVGQETALSRDGHDCFGRPFDGQAYRRRVTEVIRRVLAESKVLEALKAGPATLDAVAKSSGTSPFATFPHVVDLIAAGLVELQGTQERYPVFKSLEQQQQQQ
jgi:coenzyme F420-reducing hydrogenase delta subunit